MKKHLFIFLGSAVAGLIGLMIYFFNLSHQSFNEKDIPLAGYSKQLHFHPDSILEFSFSTYSDIKTFKRNNRLGSWNGPKHSPNSIQERLNFLANIKPYKIDNIPNPVIRIKLRHDNHEVWNISSNGKVIRFENGPLAGTGGRLGAKESALFLTGVNTFAEEKLRWCKSRPKVIKLGKITVNKIKGKWVKLDSKGRLPSGELDSSKIEKWIRKNCFVYSNKNLDSRLISPDLNNIISFEFDNEKSDRIVNIQWNKNNIVKMGSKMKFLYHEEFVSELQKLNKLIQ